MVCKHCGVANPDGAKFCHKCGSSLMDTKEPPKTEEPPKVEEAPSQQGDLAPATAHTDPVCPFCGSENCQPMMRNITKIKNSGYSATSGCCGLCLLGPFGLLCGLCGTGSKIDIKNETVWTCQKCGKQHLSQTDTLEKAKVSALSGMMTVLLVALLLSAGFHSGSVHWILPLAWAVSPIVGWALVEIKLDEELGYSFEEILPLGVSVLKYLGIAEVFVIVTLLFGGPILLNFLAEL